MRKLTYIKKHSSFLILSFGLILLAIICTLALISILELIGDTPKAEIEINILTYVVVLLTISGIYSILFPFLLRKSWNKFKSKGDINELQ